MIKLNECPFKPNQNENHTLVREQHKCISILLHIFCVEGSSVLLNTVQIRDKLKNYNAS